MDAVDLVATAESVRVDIGDVIWETLAPRKVERLENLLPRSEGDSAEAVVLPLHRISTMALETL